jgi:signal transduction histidine kinase
MLQRPSGKFYQTVVVVWLTLSFASVLLATATWVRLSHQLNAASQAVAIRLDVDSILQHLLEADSSARADVATGDPHYSAAARAAEANISPRLVELTRLAGNDRFLKGQIARVQRLVEDALKQEQETEKAMRGQGKAVASEKLNGGETEQLLAAVRREAAAIGTTPSALVFEQRAGSRAQLTRASLTSLAAGILGLGAGLFAFGLSRLTVKHQQRERELTDARLEADRRNQEKTAVLANMSHEIRTPMTAILGFGDLLDSGVLNDIQRGHLQSIRSSASSLLQLTDDMLDLSKIEAGVLELHPEMIDPREMCRLVQTLFSDAAARKNLRISCEATDELPRCLLLDGVRLRQILVNLVSNAVKFTDRGGVDLTVACEKAECDTSVTLLISVRDTGVGIPADKMEAIFSPFVQAGAHPDKERQGTGLGLAIVKRLVEAMGGSVTLTSNLDQGSLFQLRFPGIAVSERGPLQNPLILIPDSNFNRLKPATVLGVDDNETNRVLLQAMFSNSHHRLLLASSGSEAIEIARKEKPDLILLDLRMPQVNGHQVMDALVEIQSPKALPVIAVTASSFRLDWIKVKTPFDGYLQKPYSKHQLFNEMARFLPRSASAPLAKRRNIKTFQKGDVSVAAALDRSNRILAHDIKSSLAGVVMSVELLLELPVCADDEISRRIAMGILDPGRRFLEMMRPFASHAGSGSTSADDDRGNSTRGETEFCDLLRKNCGLMRSDAQMLCSQISARTKGRSAQLATNIVRSCAELTVCMEKLAAHREKIGRKAPVSSNALKTASDRTRPIRNHSQQGLLTVPAAA